MNLLQPTHDKIREIHLDLLTAQSRYKSYENVRRRDLEFSDCDEVLLKVSSTKGAVCFGTRGKLN